MELISDGFAPYKYKYVWKNQINLSAGMFYWIWRNELWRTVQISWYMYTLGSNSFSHTMSGRRFEQLLRCFNCTTENQNTDRFIKINELLRTLIRNFQNAYSPDEPLSLDEFLLLHRGRLRFKQYIKGKKCHQVLWTVFFWRV